MPEKTLREKVERAREALKWIYDRPESHIRLDEALTALEARVDEITKDRNRWKQAFLETNDTSAAPPLHGDPMESITKIIRRGETTPDAE